MKKLGLVLLLVILFVTPSWAAVKYWVGGGTNESWNSAPVTNWGSASGVRDNVTIPDATIDVIFDNSANGTTQSNLTASITVNSLNMTGWTSTLDHRVGATLTIDSQDAGGNSLILASGMTYTLGSTAKLTFTGAGTSKITTNGKVINRIEFNNAGDTFQLQDDMTISGTSAVTLSSSSFILTAGTFDANGYAVIFTGETPQIAGIAAKFYNLTRTGTAVQTGYLGFRCDAIVNGSLVLTGNSVVNRQLIYADTLGTQRSINVTGATISISNCNLRDINFINTTMPVDLSAATGGSGDCGGNTNITFTTTDDWYWQTTGAGTYNMEDNTYWFTATNGTGTRMDSDARNAKALLPQDNAFFDADSISGATTVDQNNPRVCKSLDFTNTGAVNWHINNVAQAFYGSLILTNDVTVVQGSPGTISMQGRDGSYALNCAGKTLPTTGISSPNGTITLSGNLILSYNTADLGFNYGTFNADIYNVTARYIASSTTGIKSVLMGTGTWKTYHDGNPYGWDFTGTGLTLDANTSTIILNSTDSTAYPFKGGNLTYNNLSIIGAASSGAVTFTGNNTFNTFTINAPKTVKFTAGTVTNVTSFVATGTEAAPIYLNSSTSAVAYLNDTTGTNTVYNCTINNLPAAGGATWNAYNNCTVDANSTGWITSAPGGAVDMGQVIMVM